jgi:hypothetical protein
VKKMKKFEFKVMLLVALVSLLVISAPRVAFSVDITVSAQVPDSSPGDSIIIKELTTSGQDPWTGTTVSSMNFGELTHTLSGGEDAGVWYSQKYYCVFIFTTSFGHRYEVRSTCAGLTSSANSLPTGSFGVTPGYASQDRWVSSDPASAQGAQPVGSALGSAGSAITGAGSYNAIYTSESAASDRIIRAFYSLPCYATGGANPFTGYTAIPLSQAAGTYSGTVTITIAAI